MRELYLASGSPRRAALLEQIGVPFQRLPAPDVDERVLAGETPEQYVARVARAKARAGWDSLQSTEGSVAVLGADTSVILDDRVLGKPVDVSQAAAMLRRLSGREHRVLSAVCVLYDGHVLEALSDTRVQFAQLDNILIERYLATEESYDKAGAYGIQGFGAVLVKSLTGSYSGVVGLPLSETAALLAEAEIPFWRLPLPGEGA